MLSACMIDGFGWFKEADYLRSWLFFDRVDYIFPPTIVGPLRFPEGLAKDPTFTVVKPRCNRETLDYLIEQSRFDAVDPAYSAFIHSFLPKKDLDYASMVVFCDGELQSRLNREIVDPLFSLAYLVNKLLLYSTVAGAIPIFGRSYATDIVVFKINKWSRFLSRQKSAAIVTPDQMPSLSAFAAGLSLGFIHDRSLLQTPIDRLVAFKEKSYAILQKHQAHIIEISQNFQGLPTGQAFQAHLARLRLEAKKQRIDLDSEIRESWLSLGLSKAADAVISSASLFASALGLMKLGDPTLAFSIPDALTKLGMMAGMADVSPRRKGDLFGISSGMLYLFEAQRYLGSDNTAVAPLPSESAELEINPVGVELMIGSKRSPTLASLRRLIQLVLPTDADLSAFCLDYCPKVSLRFSEGMDRLVKLNILFQMERPVDIIKYLKDYAPWSMQQHEELLEY